MEEYKFTFKLIKYYKDDPLKFFTISVRNTKDIVDFYYNKLEFFFLNSFIKEFNSIDDNYLITIPFLDSLGKIKLSICKKHCSNEDYKNEYLKRIRELFKKISEESEFGNLFNYDCKKSLFYYNDKLYYKNDKKTEKRYKAIIENLPSETCTVLNSDLYKFLDLKNIEIIIKHLGENDDLHCGDIEPSDYFSYDCKNNILDENKIKIEKNYDKHNSLDETNIKIEKNYDNHLKRKIILENIIFQGAITELVKSYTSGEEIGFKIQYLESKLNILESLILEIVNREIIEKINNFKLCFDNIKNTEVSNNDIFKLSKIGNEINYLIQAVFLSIE